MAGVPTDPYSAGLMALGSIANSPPPSSTATSNTGITFDNSGWAVNIGSGAANSQKTQLPTATQAAVQGAASLLSSPLLLIAVGAALFLFLKHK